MRFAEVIGLVMPHTAKPMGKTYKNAGGSKSQKLDMAPKAETSEGSVDAKSPVASK